MRIFNGIFAINRFPKDGLKKCRLQAASCLLIPIIIAFLGASSVSVRAGYTAVVNPNSVLVSNYQGWGTSLCWWANVVGGYPNRTNFVDLAYNQLKLNIARYNIGGGENPTNKFLAYRAQMPGFEPTNGVWNWSADANQRWVLQQALARGVNLVDAFANSPPYWMTVSGSVTGAVGSTNNLQVGDQALFAAYLANVVSNLTVLDGDHFNYVTPMNEPNGSKWPYGNSQEGCNMSQAQQAPVINDLRTALNTSLPSAGIDASEDVDPYQSYSDLISYSSPTLNNIALCTTHTYSVTGAANFANEANSLGKPKWVAEYGDSDGTGLTMARQIYNNITTMEVQAWCYWQVIDNATGWGFLYNPLVASTSSSYTTNYTINEKFYVMGQFSEFIRPGCKIISVNDTNTLAAWNPTNSTLVLVLVNNSSISTNVTYNLSDFGSVPWQVSASQTSASEKMTPLPAPLVTNGTFAIAVPADSVTTFVLTTNLTYTNSLIYSNAFTGQAVTINGTAPAVANIPGGTNAAHWAFTYTNTQDGGWLANGAIGTNAGSALLPFTPQAGAVYYLTASVTLVNIGNWIGLGFAQSAIQSGVPTSERFSDSNVQGNPWMIMQATANPTLFGGPKSTLSVNGGDLFPTNGTYTVEIVLNTLGTQWTTTAYVNGVELGATNYATNPTIGYVGFTQQGFAPGGTSGVQWNYFALSTALQPVFTTQPTSVTVPAGTVFTNTVAAMANASGGTLSYQWYDNNVPLSGATKTALIFNPISVSNTSSNYYVVVTNNYGAVTSSVASLTVYVFNPNPTNIVTAVTNNQLLLSWPADHLGWTLQVQTNGLAAGLGTNWINVSGSASVTNVVIPVNPANGSVFYRLFYTP